MHQKKTPPGLDDLHIPITWDSSFGNEENWEDNFYVQLQLGLKLNALFKRYNIEVPDNYSTTCMQTFVRWKLGKVNDPFCRLAIALACDRFHGFRVVPKPTNVGRPKKDRYSIPNMLLLGKRISEGIQNGKSASWVISRVVKESRPPFDGVKKETLERRWKIFKDTETVSGETYGQILSIPTSRECKKPAKKKTVKQEKPYNIKQAVLSKLKLSKQRIIGSFQDGKLVIT